MDFLFCLSVKAEGRQLQLITFHFVFVRMYSDVLAAIILNDYVSKRDDESFFFFLILHLFKLMPRGLLIRHQVYS